MCSVTESSNVFPGEKTRQGKSCVKCKEEAVVVTRISHAFCRECFQVYVVHKFRSALGKSKLIRDGESILVAFSGGHASAALLNLIQEGLSSRAHRKLRFTPTVVYIDETGILNLTTKERHEKIKQVESFLRKTEFPFFLTSLEQGLVQGSQLEDVKSLCWDVLQDSGSKYFLQRMEKTANLQHLFSSLSSMSAREEFLRVAKTQLLIKVASMNRFKKILVADCATRLSVRILTDIAGGRGDQVASDTNIGDHRYRDIVIIRPLSWKKDWKKAINKKISFRREVSRKELVMYNVLNGVQTFFIPSLTTKATEGSSIQQQTEAFVTGLQAEFPSTVPNIVRISEKLEPSDLRSTIGHCAVCQSALDTDVSKASALGAAEMSRRLSQNSNALLMQKCERFTKSNNESDDCCTQGTVDFRKVFCYGCQLMTKELKTTPTFNTMSVETVLKTHC